MDRALEMTVFTAVVEAGSFVGAVEGLRMSKAAVSRHVDALEQRLGVRLLQRTTRRLSLTEEGRIFYERAKEVLAWLESQHHDSSVACGLAPSTNGRASATTSPTNWQMTLFATEEHPLLDEIRSTDLDELTPREAHELLSSWQARLAGEHAKSHV